MNIPNSYSENQGGVGVKLKIALVCSICAILPYYTAVYTVDYPYRQWVQTDPYFYEFLLRQALGEEAFYRLIPLAITIQLFGTNWRALSLVIIATSICFSFLHNGYPSLLALGPASVLLSLAFLYFGGLQKHYLSGFFWCSGIHIAINLIITVLVPAFI
jgi:hypothetical protein